jgi:hypothetical protein
MFEIKAETHSVHRSITAVPAEPIEFSAEHDGRTFRVERITFRYDSDVQPDGTVTHRKLDWSGSARIVKRDRTLGEVTKRISSIYGTSAEVRDRITAWGRANDPRRS